MRHDNLTPVTKTGASGGSAKCGMGSGIAATQQASAKQLAFWKINDFMTVGSVICSTAQHSTAWQAGGQEGRQRKQQKPPGWARASKAGMHSEGCTGTSGRAATQSTQGERR